jgi:hypothetical protein
MRAFPRIVAAMLGILLGGLPLFAAIHCTTASCAPRRCACCASMQRSGMTFQSATVGSIGQSDIPHPLCSEPSSTGSFVPAIVGETRRAIPQVDSSPAVDASIPIPPGTTRVIRMLPDQSIGSRAQSVLCTFLI